MPSLVFSINFDKYYKQINRITYINETTRKPYYFKFIQVNGVTITPTYVLELVVKKLCHPSKPKFDSTNNVCSAVNSCTNASLCIDENVPIMCNSGFVYDPSTATNPQCNGVCSLRVGRGAMSDKSKSICNRKCDDLMSSCQNINSSQTFDNYNNNLCPTGYDRYGYKCINQTVSKKSNFN